jgi:hypothetical protein
MGRPILHSVIRTATVPVADLFDVVVAEDVLPKVLHGYLVLPAVIGTSDVTGPWSVPGSQRRVLTSDGRSVRERLTGWERPTRFAYRVDDFSGTIAQLADHADGEWEFSDAPGGSSFRWTYSFIPSSVWVQPALRAFVAGMWSGYMDACADRCVELAEASRSQAVE